MRAILVFDSAHDFQMKWIVFAPEDLWSPVGGESEYQLGICFQNAKFYFPLKENLFPLRSASLNDLSCQLSAPLALFSTLYTSPFQSIFAGVMSSFTRSVLLNVCFHWQVHCICFSNSFFFLFTHAILCLYFHLLQLVCSLLPWAYQPNPEVQSTTLKISSWFTPFWSFLSTSPSLPCGFPSQLLVDCSKFQLSSRVSPYPL